MKGFDYEKLRRAMAAHKGSMTYDEMEEATGVTRKTLHAFLAGTTNKLQPETLVKYCRWLGLPVESFLVGGARPNRETTLDKIDLTLSADPALDTTARHALSDLMRTAYAAVV